MRTRSSALALSAALALVLTGCGGGSNDSSKSEAAAPSESAAASAAKESNAAASESVEAAQASAESSAADSDGLTFGDTHTWKDGLAITISEPVEYTPSPSAAMTSGEGTPTKFAVTLKNGTKEPVEAMMVNIQASSGGKADESIIDSASDIMPATVAVQPGKELTWNVAFDVTDPADLVLDVTSLHDFAADKVYFKAN